jgi:hypothetical protein
MLGCVGKMMRMMMMMMMMLVQVLPIPSLPPESKYSEQTWEWTIVRDYYDHLTETAAHLLDEAL